MLDSIALYGGIALFLVGVLLLPWRRVRRRAVGLAASGFLIVAAALALPAREHHAAVARSRLDVLVPVWEFAESHQIEIAAPPDRVYEAIRSVTADDIRFFRVLTSIRRGFRKAPEGILNPSRARPILDVATRSGFAILHDEKPHEIVLATVIVPPHDAAATMNFLITAGSESTLLSTETRVHATTSSARRRFAIYWRMIHPGSAIIRRSWLRAIKERAEGKSNVRPHHSSPRASAFD